MKKDLISAVNSMQHMRKYLALSKFYSVIRRIEVKLKTYALTQIESYQPE